MTQNIIKPYTATQAYFDHIASGDGDFDEISAFFLEHIRNREGNADCAIKILDLTVKAYEYYLENKILGMIQSLIQYVFGNNSNYESAKKLVDDHKNIINKSQQPGYKDRFDRQVEM